MSLNVHLVAKSNGQGHGLWKERSQSLPWKYVKHSRHLIRSIDSNSQICNRKSSFGPQIFGDFQRKVPSFLSFEAILLLSQSFLLGELFPHFWCVRRGGKGRASSCGAGEAPRSQPSPWLGRVPWPQLLFSLFQQHIPLPTLPSAKPFPSKRPSSRSSREKVRGGGHPTGAGGSSVSPGVTPPCS